MSDRVWSSVLIGPYQIWSSMDVVRVCRLSHLKIFQLESVFFMHLLFSVAASIVFYDPLPYFSKAHNCTVLLLQRCSLSVLKKIKIPHTSLLALIEYL